jgi:CheY-like chemotaxis protein
MFHILVGEDNAIAQQVMEALLEDRCSKLSIADSYAQLIELLQRETCDLLLLDYHLDKDANIGVSEIRLVNPKIPIYILSAEPERSLKEKMKGIEVDGFIKKPIDTRELDRIIRPFSYQPLAAMSTCEPNLKLDNLKELLGNNPDRLLRIVKTFIQDVPVDFLAMEEHIEQRKWAMLKLLVHRVRASYGYLGLQSLHKVMSDWELDIEKEQNTEQYASILNKLKIETIRIIKQLETTFLR